MNRLITYDENQKRYFHKFTTDGFDTMFQKVCTKLYDFEELEERVGCPLDVVFTALNDGIWSVRYNTYQHSKISRLIFMSDGYYLVVGDSYYNLKDYKKTWWLSETKER